MQGSCMTLRENAIAKLPKTKISNQIHRWLQQPRLNWHQIMSPLVRAYKQANSGIQLCTHEQSKIGEMASQPTPLHDCRHPLQYHSDSLRVTCNRRNLPSHAKICIEEGDLLPPLTSSCFKTAAATCPTLQKHCSAMHQRCLGLSLRLNATSSFLSLTLFPTLCLIDLVLRWIYASILPAMVYIIGAKELFQSKGHVFLEKISQCLVD